MREPSAVSSTPPTRERAEQVESAGRRERRELQAAVVPTAEAGQRPAARLAVRPTRLRIEAVRARS